MIHEMTIIVIKLGHRSDRRLLSFTENLLNKPTFEYGSLVEKLEQYHVENEQDLQRPLKSALKSDKNGSPGRHPQTELGNSDSKNGIVTIYDGESTVL